MLYAIYNKKIERRELLKDEKVKPAIVNREIACLKAMRRYCL